MMIRKDERAEIKGVWDYICQAVKAELPRFSKENREKAKAIIDSPAPTTDDKKFLYDMIQFNK